MVVIVILLCVFAYIFVLMSQFHYQGSIPTLCLVYDTTINEKIHIAFNFTNVNQFGLSSGGSALKVLGY